ncbi:hypothetical protein J6590_098261, partial [Homalodisca vitripennis]
KQDLCEGKEDSRVVQFIFPGYRNWKPCRVDSIQLLEIVCLLAVHRWCTIARIGPKGE